MQTITLNEGLESIEGGVFYECRSLESVKLPNSVEKIGYMAFSFSGINSVNIPNSLTYIESRSFDNCYKLKAVTIPSGVTSIGTMAFYHCTSLSSITIPSTVNSIGGLCFSGCESLLNVYCYNNNVPKISNNTFDNWITEATLHIPAVAMDEYKNSEYWNSFKRYVSLSGYSLQYIVNGSEYKIYQYEEGQAIIPEVEPTFEGYSFSGWSEIPETMPDHDVIVTGSFTVNQYTITYMMDGSIYKTSELDYGSVITPEAEPLKEGYTFSGWSEIPETMPAHDVTVTGSFTVNQYTITYMVDGSVYKTTELDYGSVITPEAEPSKDGYSFSGWSEIPEKMPAHDVTITGSFSKGKKCAKPTVIYEGGKLLFSCSTPGAKCVSTITDNDITTYIGNERALTATYRIRFYAMAQGYEDSEPAVVTLCWLDYVPTTVGLEEVEMNEVKAMPILIETHDNTLLLNGIKPDTPIRVYDLSGRLMGKGSAMSGSTQIHTQLKAGQIAVIHIGEQSVKVKVQ